MIDVYVRDIDEAKGHWLGAFRPEQLKDLPELFEMFVTANVDGEDCKLVEPQRVTITLEAAQVEWLRKQAPTVSEAIRGIIQKDIAEW